MKLRTILALIAVMLSCHAGAQSRDEIILDMNQAFKQGNRQRLTQLLPLARGHVLEPYAAYWELKARLDVASAREIQDFMARYAGTYQEDRMRNDWLQVLGQRRDWTALAAEYPRYRMNDDKEVRCYALLAQFLREGAAAPASLAEEVRHAWLAQREADDGCTLAAQTLIADPQGSRHMTANDAWRKARLATEGNRLKAAAAAVEIAAPRSIDLFNDLSNSPTKFLTSRRLAVFKSKREMVTLALIKLATSDLDGAAVMLEGKWGPQLSAEERNWVWGVIGRQAAGKLSGVALDHFAKVTRDSDLTDDMLAWKARAALRSPRGMQWPLVLQAINAMSEEARKEPVWVYWKARALLVVAENEANRADAQRLLESIASVRGFYEQLALEELGQKITAPQRPAPLTDAEKEGARQNLSLQRGIYAILLGLRPEGVREWNYATNLAKPGGMNDRELLAAAQLACDRELWDRCINTSDRTRSEVDFELRFPTPFRESVVKRAKEISLDPAYVYGLIRQESRFVMDARSHVGASGLMQVMPATARWTAKKIGLGDFTIDQLNDRQTNIAIGTGYLKLVLDDFNGSMPMAAAAYNAGPGRPRAWRNGPVIEGAAWAENVPFTETRDYVKKVLSNTTNYAALLTGQPQSLKARLGKIGPRDASQPEPYRDIP
ncbi:MAG: lytic transglycosylase domain-containing protein [Ramlibacter sp.]|nr:lytic transglycosylase domain-containing protein [Ramlibacter sp.]